MTLSRRNLKPYKSVTLARLAEGSERGVVNGVLEDLQELLGLDGEQERIVTLRKAFKETVQLMAVREETDEETGRVVRRWEPDGTDEIRAGFLHYVERRAPGWLAGNGIQDELNHLAVVVQRRGYLALYLSDGRRRDALRKALGGKEGRAFPRLQALPRGVLNAAFVQGPARTLWLSAIHAPVPVKPDTKMLSGLDLRDALDPLGDQTYHFTAARSTVPNLYLPVGVSPEGSRIWVGATQSWTDFGSTMASILRYLQSDRPPVRDPLPVLAVPVLPEDVSPMDQAFELHFLPPELLADDPEVPAATRELMERWAYRAEFEIFDVTTLEPPKNERRGGDEEKKKEDVERKVEVLACHVDLEGHRLGDLHLTIDTTNPEAVRILEHRVEPAADSAEEDVRELEYVSGQMRWFKVWFETGQAIADGEVFEIRHRDEPFEHFRWIDLDGYAPRVEKFWKGPYPDDALDRIGGEGSLFCWVKNNWSNPGDPLTTSAGWLACDDGSMEIADFIHLDDQSEPPVVSLIHVKGAKSDKPGRQISVSAYEVVVGQAVKNLRHLDRIHLAEGLADGLGNKISELVWHDRRAADRQGMIDALMRIGTSYRRLVVVLQPHVLRSRIRAARADGAHPDRGRLRQLDTLLHSAEASCRSLGAQLVVLSDQR